MSHIHCYITRLALLTICATVSTIGFVDATRHYIRSEHSPISHFLWLWAYIPFVSCYVIQSIIVWWLLVRPTTRLRRWIVYGLTPMTTFTAVISVTFTWYTFMVQLSLPGYIVTYESSSLLTVVISYLAAVVLPKTETWQNGYMCFIFACQMFVTGLIYEPFITTVVALVIILGVAMVVAVKLPPQCPIVW